jgi:UDP-glucose 4-epimerase
MTFIPKSVLIIGIQGALAKITAELLIKNFKNIKIFGVDSRPITDLSHRPEIQFEEIKYTRNHFEKIFREHQFDSVLHLGRLGHAKAVNDIDHRINVNLIGTNTILELSQKFLVKKVVILSTHHVYGAMADNPMFLTENFPLRASFKFPELRDVVEMDQICTNWMWKNQNQIETIVLRPANIVGPQINNSISKYLKTPYAPIPIDYNPMFQFVHEFDMAQVISLSLKKLSTGVYNVANDDMVSLNEAVSIVGIKKVPMPIIAVAQVANVIRPLWQFPRYLFEYIKFPTTLDNGLLKAKLGEDPFRFKSVEALELLKLD